MNSVEILKYPYYKGVAIRLSDMHTFEKVVITLESKSLKNISDIANNGCRNGNQDIHINSLCIKHSDYDEFIKDQTSLVNDGSSIVMKSTINKHNFKIELEGVKEDNSRFVIIISSIQFSLDSSEPIFLEKDNEVVFEDVKAVILGGCIVREGGLS